ncbi:transposase, partial [Klebsiella pneumoniae]
DFELLLCHGTVCVVGKIRDLILQLSKSSIYSTKPTNTTLLSEKVVIYYEKRGNAENYIKEAKYDMAVGHLLLKSFWANEAVFQMMMLSYNLFLLFKFDSLDSSEYRQQIKTFRLKYVFLAAKIIKTARYVIMKLSENYPYKGVYEK